MPKAALKIPKLPKKGALLLEYTNPAAKDEEIYICVSNNDVTVGDTRKRTKTGALRNLGKKFHEATPTPAGDRKLAAAFYEQRVAMAAEQGFVLKSKKTVPPGRAYSFPL